MKAINKLTIVLVAMVIAGAYSCKDELPRESMEDLTQEERVSIESDKEALYHYQTNKDIILHSLIQYDDQEQMYFLDASEEDIERLGITIEAYQEIQSRVEQLNQVDIERQ